MNRSRKYPQKRLLQLLALCLWALAQSNSLGAAASENKVMQFPRSYSLGTLDALPSDTNSAGKSYGKLGPARGRIVVPDNAFVTLVLGKDGCKHPDALTKLPPNSIQVLKLTLVSFEDGEDGLSDKVLTYAASMIGLKEINLTGSDVTDAGLACLSKAKSLEILQAGSTMSDGSCLKNLATLSKLNKLWMGNTSLKLENLKYLPKLAALRALELERVGLDNAAVDYIGQCAELRELTIGKNPDVTDSSIKALAKLENLHTLDLAATGISVKGLAGLKHLPLKWIGLPKTNYTSTEMQELKRLFPNTKLQSKFPANRHIDPSDANELYAPLH